MSISTKIALTRFGDNIVLKLQQLRSTGVPNLWSMEVHILDLQKSAGKVRQSGGSPWPSSVAEHLLAC